MNRRLLVVVGVLAVVMLVGMHHLANRPVEPASTVVVQEYLETPRPIAVRPERRVRSHVRHAMHVAPVYERGTSFQDAQLSERDRILLELGFDPSRSRSLVIQ
jgi:hypothetical protein